MEVLFGSNNMYGTGVQRHGVQMLEAHLETLYWSGNMGEFDAPRWVSTWLVQPLPALGGLTPASYMDTFEG
jgi:hypothetical protein